MRGLRLGLGLTTPQAAAGGGGASFAVQWTDDFERADSATLGGDWTEDGTESQYHIASGRLNRDTTLGPPGGACWVASGAAVASGKTKMRLDFEDCKAAGVINIWQAGFLDAPGKITSNSNGYILRRYLNTVVYLCRVVAGTITDLGSTVNAGMSANASAGKDIGFEVEQSGGDVIVRLYADGVLIDTRTDTTPGAAVGIFTNAYPTTRSPIHDWNGHSASRVSVSY